MDAVPKKSFFEKAKEIIPMVTPLLMFSAIAFTYFTYFFDINRTPQLIIKNNITKIQETEDYYILKIVLDIENKSKSRVEVVANMGKLYGFKSRIDSSVSESDFFKRLNDRVLALGDINKDEAFELHKHMEQYDRKMISVFQPLHNATWFVPLETVSTEFITAVPKEFDVAYYYFFIDYTNDEKGIYTKYNAVSKGEPENIVYALKGKDTVVLHKVGNESVDSLIVNSEDYNIYATGSQYVIWLRSGDTEVKDLGKSRSADDENK